MRGYFDHNATTPLDPRVRDAMLPWLGDFHGNPSSAHGPGRAARDAVVRAREQVAELLGGHADDIVFTGSGSEANNAVIDAVAAAAGYRGHLVAASFEHPSIRAATASATARGMTATTVAPGADGVVGVERVMDAVRDDTRLVSLMLANNELGTIQPVAEVAARCRPLGIPVLTDAVQAVGKIPVRVDQLGVDYLTLGGHKFHGPLGAAALWIRPGTAFAPLVRGGAQEGGRRAGTENVPALVGLGAACALADAELGARHDHLARLRDRLEDAIGTWPEVILHCREAPRLPHTCHFALRGRVGFEVMQALDAAGFAVSIGAACGSGQPQPSPALLAMGLTHEEALGSLRVSLGMTTSDDEIGALIDALRAVLDRSLATSSSGG